MRVTEPAQVRLRNRGMAAVVILALLVSAPVFASRSLASPGPTLRIVDAAGNTPVVNEGGRVALRVVDGSGNAVSASSWSTDNKSVGKVKRSNGLLRGKTFGFATVTAQTPQGPVSGFVVCARLRRQNGAMTQGDTKTDTGGNVYLSSPTRHVIYKATAASADVFAGESGMSGYQDGAGGSVRFNGPAGIGVDNRSDGGLYVADSSNHCVRKIDFRGRSSLAAGTPGLDGTMHGDANPMSEAVLSGPRGVASVGSNMFVTDTGNHCVWYVDVQRQRVQLVAGDPGAAGQANGEGRAARFNSPSGITINTRGNLLAVADTGNNVVRLISIVARAGSDGGVIGQVTTLGLASSARNARILEKLGDDRGTDEIAFDAPVSVSFDGVDNVYVIDNQTASVVTRPLAASGRPVQRVDLAQVGTLGDPASVTVRQTQAFVLDASATSDASAVNVVEVGPPEIRSLSDDSDRLEGGKPITILGTNFAPESKLTLGDTEISDYEVRSSTEIRFIVPAQISPGALTLSVSTRGGTDQAAFTFIAKSLAEFSPGEITTVVGGVRNTGDGGLATKATFAELIGIILDSRGNILVTDPPFSRVRRIDAETGLVTAFAGNGARGDSGDGGLATAARFASLHSIAFDGDGNLSVSDETARRIRRVDAVTGIVTTIVGTGVFGGGGDGGAATSATIRTPQGLAFDQQGNLYFADGLSSVVRRVDRLTGVIARFAGTGFAGDTGDGGSALTATLSAPEMLAFDSSFNLYVADRGSLKIRRIDRLTGVISTVAGNGQSGSMGDGGPARDASLDPSGMVFDGDGNLYVSDATNNVIRRIDAATGIIRRIAGTAGQFGFSGDGGPATSAKLGSPRGLALGAGGFLFFCASGNLRVRVINLESGTISTVCGNFFPLGPGNPSPAVKAFLARSLDVEVEPSGDILIAESGLHRIRRLKVADGTIRTVTGQGEPGFSGDSGPASAAKLWAPRGLAVDPAGRILIADTFNHRIRRIENGIIRTIAGTGVAGFGGDGGPATGAMLNQPHGIAVDASGVVYIADSSNNRIRRIDPANGTIATIAGTGDPAYGGDNGPAVAAQLSTPIGLELEGASGLLVADQGNNCIRRLDLVTGVIVRFAGTTVRGYIGDGGPALSAQFRSPSWVAVDGAGNVLIADSDNHVVRRIDAASGRITTLAGTGFNRYTGDGGQSLLAELAGPQGIVVDREGNVYFSDAGNGAIRVIKQAAVPIP